jgi:tetratricopeptide (TPR) repeat protein
MSSAQQASEPLSDSAPTVDPLQPDRSSHSMFARRSNLAAWLALGLAAIATFATLPLIWTPIRLQEYRSVMLPEWHLYLLGAQLLAMPFFLLFGGVPRSWRGWCVLLFSNLWIAGLACLSWMDLLKLAAVHALVLGLRIAILSLWLFVVVGALVAVEKLANGRRSANGVSTTGKLWFSALVFLLAAEPSAALLSLVLDNPNRVTLPRTLPEPPPGELHVAFVGESTMAGFPYMKFGIPKVVGWQLEQMYPDQKIVLDDVSAVGLNLRTAMQRLNKLTVRPQLLLLYSGHNEFFYNVEELATDIDTPWERFDRYFEWSPLFRALDQRISRHIGVQDLEAQGARTLVDRPIASQEARAKRLARFGGQLEQLAQWCEDKEIASVWFDPAGSEADYAPNRSCLDHTVTDAERQEIESIEHDGRALQEAGRWKEADANYQAAVDRYPEFAEFHFQLAECQMHEGLSTAAKPHYFTALELDGLPVRMTAPWRQKVREVANRHAIPLVTTTEVLRPHTPSGILDRSVFLDYVHPNLHAYYYLGMSAAERIRRDRLVPHKFGQPETSHRDFATAIAWAGFTAKDLALAYRRTAEADRLMSRLRFESSRLMRDAKQYEDWSRQLEKGPIAPGEAGTESLK